MTNHGDNCADSSVKTTFLSAIGTTLAPMTISLPNSSNRVQHPPRSCASSRKRRRASPLTPTGDDKWASRSSRARRASVNQRIHDEIRELNSLQDRRNLSSDEDKELKKLRRKQKNREAAQNSRNRKKVYLETLERKLEIMETENSELKSSIHDMSFKIKKVEEVESQNRELKETLKKLQQENAQLKSRKSKEIEPLAMPGTAPTITTTITMVPVTATPVATIEHGALPTLRPQILSIKKEAHTSSTFGESAAGGTDVCSPSFTLENFGNHSVEFDGDCSMLDDGISSGNSAEFIDQLFEPESTRTDTWINNIDFSLGDPSMDTKFTDHPIPLLEPVEITVI